LQRARCSKAFFAAAFFVASGFHEVADAAAAMLAAHREAERMARAEFAELQTVLLRELPKAERRT
jgi:hypothetical protein